MNRGRITAITSIFAPVAVGLAVGLVTMSGAIASTRDVATNATVTTRTATDTAVTTSDVAPKFVLLGCDNKAEVAPSGISNCGDGAVGLKDLHWTSWTSHQASGYGTYYLNDCTPTCVGGHFHLYPALVVLWGSAPVQGHPTERKYTEMTLIFTGKRPPFYHEVNGKQVVTYPVTQTWPTFP
jgi:hypothetical protein